MGNILIVSSVFPPEEVTSAGMTFDLAMVLSEKNHLTVLRPKPSRPAGVDYTGRTTEYNEFKTITIDSYTCPYSKMLNRFWESTDFGLRSAKYIIKHQKEIDFIYNSGWHLFGLFIVSVVAKWLKIPYMVPIQDVYPETLFTRGIKSNVLKNVVNGLLSPIDLFTQKNAQIIRTNTEEMAAYLSKTRKINKDKFLVVYNWQNENDFKTVENLSNPDSFVFSYVGSINVHSNVDLIIKSYGMVAAGRTEMRIYGGGNKTDECKELAKKLNLAKVSFGYVARNDVPRVQAEADVLLMALPTGNGRLCMPSKLVSYMLSAKPVLASIDIDCEAARIIKESGCGIVVNPDDTVALADGMKRIIEIPFIKRCEMGSRAREYAQRVLSKEVNLKKVKDEIEKIVENNS